VVVVVVVVVAVVVAAVVAAGFSAKTLSRNPSPLAVWPS